jgi:predicted nucleotidyltransferase
LKSDPRIGRAGKLKSRAFCAYHQVMNRADVIARLRAHEAELKQLGVQHLYLFGSTARGGAGKDSDADLFFDHERGKLSLFQLINLKERAAEILGCKTEIMTRRSLHPVLRETIEASALQVF